MVAIQGFNCYWLSYKRTYNFIIKEYKCNKRANEVSKTNKKQECR